MTDHFDAIIVGGGTSGSIVARRLVDAGKRVQLLEAGGRDENPQIHDMAGVTGLWRSADDWAYTTIPQQHAADREIFMPRGKVLGGSHALNAAIWVRGHQRDYDGWVEQGCDGWSWADVLPVFQEMEKYHGGPGQTRGVDGLIDIDDDYPLVPIQQSILDAAVQIGLPHNPDYNDGVLDGVSQEQITVRDGRRLTTYRAYLHPVEGDPLLTVTTNAWVHRVILEGVVARGVEYEVDGELRQSTADIVVLAAGAIDSPRVLLRSGIGPAAELEAVGVTPTIDRAGVGKNLHDHYLVPVIFATDTREVEPLQAGNSVSQTHVFWRSDPTLEAPDTQPLNFSMPLYDRTWMAGPASGFTLMGGLLATRSRGSITLTGPDARDPLAIDPSALSDDHDVAVLAASVAQMREIGRAPALADDWGARELYPGPEVSDAELEHYIRKTVTTYHHQVGTCRMGVDDLAVVDPRLRVHGVTGLWVVDASIIPTVTTGNTNAPAAMIAERGARFILEDQSHGRE